MSFLEAFSFESFLAGAPFLAFLASLAFFCLAVLIRADSLAFSALLRARSARLARLATKRSALEKPRMHLAQAVTFLPSGEVAFCRFGYLRVQLVGL